MKTLQYLVLSFSFLMFVFLGACSPAVSNVKPLSPDEKFGAYVNHLRDMTVVLLDKEIEDGELNYYEPLCTGVWVDKEHILTAAHCTTADQLVMRFETFKDYKANDGEFILKHPVRQAYVVKVDKNKDLALLVTVEKAPEHSIAKLAKKSYPGQRLYLIGHTAGLMYNYLPGDISATRDLVNPAGVKMKLFQIHANSYFGYSGGGAFDRDGNLLGTCSFSGGRIPAVSFYVHRTLIKAFLKDELK